MHPKDSSDQPYLVKLLDTKKSIGFSGRYPTLPQMQYPPAILVYHRGILIRSFILFSILTTIVNADLSSLHSSYRNREGKKIDTETIFNIDGSLLRIEGDAKISSHVVNARQLGYVATECPDSAVNIQRRLYEEGIETNNKPREFHEQFTKPFGNPGQLILTKSLSITSSTGTESTDEPGHHFDVGTIIVIDADSGCHDEQPRYYRVINHFTNTNTNGSYESTTPHPVPRYLSLQVEGASFVDCFHSGTARILYVNPAHMAQAAADYHVRLENRRRLFRRRLSLIHEEGETEGETIFQKEYTAALHEESKNPYAVIDREVGPSETIVQEWLALHLAGQAGEGPFAIIPDEETNRQATASISGRRLDMWKDVVNELPVENATNLVNHIYGKEWGRKLIDTAYHAYDSNSPAYNSIDFAEEIIRYRRLHGNVHFTNEDSPKQDRKLFLTNFISAAKEGVNAVKKTGSDLYSKGKAIVDSTTDFVTKGYVIGKESNPLANFKALSFNYDGYNNAVEAAVEIWRGNDRFGKGVGASVECRNCYAYATPSLNFEISAQLSMTGMKLEYVRLAVAIDYGANLQLVGKLKGMVTTNRKVKIMNPVSLSTLTIPIGPIPIVITPSISLDAECSIESTTEVSASMRVTVQPERYELGFQYSQGSPRTIIPRGAPQITTTNPEISMQGSAQIRLSIIPKLTLTLYKTWPLVLMVSATGAIELSVNDKGMGSYQLKYGLDATFFAQELAVSLGVGPSLKLGTPVLPWAFNSPLVTLRPLRCALCSGTVSLLPSSGGSNTGIGSAGGGSSNGGSSGGNIAKPFGFVAVENLVSYTWSVGDWSVCSVPCSPGGQQSRTAICVVNTKGQSITVEESKCDFSVKPMTLQSCNANVPCNEVGISGTPPTAPVGISIPSWLTTCSASVCPLKHIGDGVCQTACNTAGCIYDGGDCIKENYDPCKEFMSCDTCLKAVSTTKTQSNENGLPSCGWCTTGISSGKCMRGGISGPRDGPNTCENVNISWIGSSCSAKDTRLAFTAPSSGQFYKAKNVVSVTWTGGRPSNVGGQVHLRYLIGSANSSTDVPIQSGYGIPDGKLTNTGSFSWTVPEGAPVADVVRLLIIHTEDDNNFALSNTFKLDGTPIPGYFWKIGTAGKCSKYCGGGTSTRTVQCIRKVLTTETVVADTECTSRSAEVGNKPATSLACNSEACPSVCPAVPLCTSNPSACGPCTCRRQASNSPDEFCGMVAQTAFGNTVFGCDTRGNGYQFCCQNQNLFCDDGCSNDKAAYTVVSTGSCSATCGGGTQYISYSCRGKYSKYSTASLTCQESYCPGTNPSGNYRCNVQPCETFNWVTSEWTDCTRACEGLGTQERNVTCFSSTNGRVSDASCSGTKPDTVQQCNFRQCNFFPIQAVTPGNDEAVASGRPYNVSWVGGKEESTIIFELAPVNQTVYDILSTALNIPDDNMTNTNINTTYQYVASQIPFQYLSAYDMIISNNLSFIWNVPSSLPDGKYLFRLSSANKGVNASFSTPFTIRGLSKYTLSLFNFYMSHNGASNLATCLNFAVRIEGSYGIELISQNKLTFTPSNMLSGGNTLGSTSIVSNTLPTSTIQFTVPSVNSLQTASFIINYNSGTSGCGSTTSVKLLSAKIEENLEILSLGSGISMPLSTANSFSANVSLGTAGLVLAGNQPLSSSTVLDMDVCSSRTSCFTCGSLLGCSWCQGNATGVSGQSIGVCRPTGSYTTSAINGAGNGVCADLWPSTASSTNLPAMETPGAVYDDASECPDPCSVLTANSTNCLFAQACGFCPSSWNCMTGNSSRPTYKVCSSDWTTDPFAIIKPSPLPTVSSTTTGTSTSTSTASSTSSTTSTSTGTSTSSETSTSTSTSTSSATGSASTTRTPSITPSPSGSSTSTSSSIAAESGTSAPTTSNSPNVTSSPGPSNEANPSPSSSAISVTNPSPTSSSDVSKVSVSATPSGQDEIKSSVSASPASTTTISSNTPSSIISAETSLSATNPSSASSSGTKVSADSTVTSSTSPIISSVTPSVSYSASPGSASSVEASASVTTSPSASPQAKIQLSLTFTGITVDQARNAGLTFTDAIKDGMSNILNIPSNLINITNIRTALMGNPNQRILQSTNNDLVVDISILVPPAQANSVATLITTATGSNATSQQTTLVTQMLSTIASSVGVNLAAIQLTASTPIITNPQTIAIQPSSKSAAEISSSSSLAGIAGGVIGGLFVVSIIGCLLYCFVFRDYKTKKTTEKSVTPTGTFESTTNQIITILPAETGNTNGVKRISVTTSFEPVPVQNFSQDNPLHKKNNQRFR